MRRLSLALVLALALAGCGGGNDGEGGGASLTVYSGRNENLVGPLFEMFTKATKIKVDVRYAGSAEFAAQLLEEGDRSPADVFLSQDAGALGALNRKGQLVGLDAALTSAVPERFRAKNGTWIGVSGRARVLAYNPKKVPAPPKSVFALTEPAWRGRIGYAPTNASFQSFVTGMRVLSGEDRTKAWLTGLEANQPKAYSNNLQVLEAVDRGEVDIGLVNHYYWFEKAAEVGKDKMTAQISFLDARDPGALVNVAGVAILRSAKHLTEAHRFLEYLVSVEAQTYFRDKTYEYPLAGGVSQTEGLPPLASVSGPPIDLSDLATLEETLTLLDETGIT